jgi:hypothetical protein
MLRVRQPVKISLPHLSLQVVIAHRIQKEYAEKLAHLYASLNKINLATSQPGYDSVAQKMAQGKTASSNEESQRKPENKNDLKIARWTSLNKISVLPKLAGQSALSHIIKVAKIQTAVKKRAN